MSSNLRSYTGRVRHSRVPGRVSTVLTARSEHGVQSIKIKIILVSSTLCEDIMATANESARAVCRVGGQRSGSDSVLWVCFKMCVAFDRSSRYSGMPTCTGNVCAAFLYVFKHTYTSIHICTYKHTHVCIDMCVYVYMNIDAYTYIDTYKNIIHIYAYTYIYIYKNIIHVRVYI